MTLFQTDYDFEWTLPVMFYGYNISNQYYKIRKE